MAFKWWGKTSLNGDEAMLSLQQQPLTTDPTTILGTPTCAGHHATHIRLLPYHYHCMTDGVFQLCNRDHCSIPMRLRISDFRNLSVWRREGPELPQQNAGAVLRANASWMKAVLRSLLCHAQLLGLIHISQYSSIASNVTWAEKALTFHFQTHRSTKRVLSAPPRECSQFMCNIPLFLSLSGFLL